MFLKPILLKLAAITLITGLVVGCGGGGGGNKNNTTTAAVNNTPAASVSLQSSASLVSPGGSVTLTWSSSNADSCSASGGWSGSKSASGNESVGPLQADTSFTLSCSGPGGGGVRQLTVQVDNGSGVSVSLTANPNQVPANGSSTLDWTSANATSCTAAGGWSGSRPLSGSFGTGALTQNTNYQITCSGPGGSAVSMVSVEVLDKILRWQAPTQNVDGSPLNDLAGYYVYWGTQSRNYTGAGGGNFRIDSPGTTQWEANLAPGPYYFALTAFDSDGNQSAYSNEVLKTIP